MQLYNFDFINADDIVIGKCVASDYKVAAAKLKVRYGNLSYFIEIKKVNKFSF